MKPITEIQKEIDYSNEIINNFWLQIDTTHSQKQDSHLISFHGNLEKITDCINDASETICIYSNELSNELLNAILSASPQVRVYLLTNDFNAKKEELKSLSENCLIRILNSSYQGSFILVDIQSKFRGFFFSGSFLAKDLEDNNRFLIALEEEQKDFFFQLFCEWFWKEAEHEILTKEQAEHPIKIESQPFDFLFPKPEFISNNGIEKLFKNILNQNSTIHLSSKNINKKLEDFFLESHSSNFIYTNLKNNEIDSLNTLSEKNTLYVFDDHQNENLWEFITNHHETFLIFNRRNVDDYGWIFELTKNQIKEFSGLLKNTKIAYQYKNQDTRENLKGNRIYLPEKKEKKDIKEKEVINLEDIHISDLKKIQDENDFSSKQPKQFTDPLWASQVIYKWKILPPLLPENIDKDPLYNKWENNHFEIITTINNLIKRVDEINKEESIFSKFSGLFKTSNLKSLVEIKKELEKEKHKLEQKKLSVHSESERKDLKDLLENLFSEIEEHKKTKVKDVEEYKKKKQEELNNYQTDNKKINDSINNLRNQIKSKENQLKELQQRKNAVQTQIKKLNVISVKQSGTNEEVHNEQKE